MRILVVDDDYASRLKLKALLHSIGDVDSASDGELALCMFEKAIQEGVPYELVTMDIGLPDMRGHEVVQRMRQVEDATQAYLADSEMKVLMITGMQDAKNIIASFRGGCEGYLVKPVTREKLQESLKELAIKCEW